TQTAKAPSRSHTGEVPEPLPCLRQPSLTSMTARVADTPHADIAAKSCAGRIGPAARDGGRGGAGSVGSQRHLRLLERRGRSPFGGCIRTGTAPPAVASALLFQFERDLHAGSVGTHPTVFQIQIQ